MATETSDTGSAKMPSTYQSLGEELLRASKEGDLDKVRMLLEKDVDPAFQDSSGNTPAHYAANSEVLEALYESAKRLESLEDYMNLTQHHASGECWTCTPPDDISTDTIPLLMYGNPVVIPVQNQYPPRGDLSPPEDPFPQSIDPTAYVSDEIIQEIFNTYDETIGFYLLINGYLQLIVHDDFDYDQALSQRPQRFGGLKVSYIVESLTPTANGEVSSSAATSHAAASSSSILGRKISAADIEKPNNKTHRASIGVMTRSNSDNRYYLTIPTHLVTATWIGHHSRGIRGKIRGKEKDLPKNKSWLDEVQIFSSLDTELGQATETFDPEPDIFPSGYPHDTSLVEVMNTEGTLFSGIKAPVPMGWLDPLSWSGIKSRTTELVLLNQPPGSSSDAKSIGLNESQLQPVGDAIFFMNQPKHRQKGKGSWDGVISRALLFRARDTAVSSGTAVCVRKMQADGTESAEVAGFVSFSQTGSSVAKYDISDKKVSSGLLHGSVAFYGAFQVPEKLREHSIL